MKKLICAIMALCLLVSLVACAAGNTDTGATQPAQTEATTPAAETPEETPADESSEEEAPAPEDTAAEDENADFYVVATSYSKKDVEAYAAEVRKEILDKDWKALSDKVAYPITVKEKELNTADDFVAFMNEQELTDEFVKAIENETCSEMFCNSHGIMFSDGEVWFAEILPDTNAEQGELKIIGINL